MGYDDNFDGCGSGASNDVSVASSKQRVDTDAGGDLDQCTEDSGTNSGDNGYNSGSSSTCTDDSYNCAAYQPIIHQSKPRMQET